jgi:hypothetical protein
MGSGSLERKLSSVMGRVVRLRLLRCQALAWLALLLPTIAAMLLLGTPSAGFASEFIVLAVATLVGILLARVLTRPPTPIETARLVERADPELNDALLTAVQILSQPALQPAVLSQMAVEDAESLVHGRDWSRVVPRRQVAIWSLISTSCFLLMVASVMAAGRYSRTIARSELPSTPITTESQSTAPTELIVEPGNTELELGSALTVVARFPGTPPERAVLQFENTAGQTRELVMSETVDAGVFAARMEQINQDGVYRIRYTQPASTTQSSVSPDFSIRTFERPRLLQLDAVITPPAWSGRPTETLEDVLRLTVAEGSQVLLRLKLNKPSAAELHPEAGSPLIPTPNPADPTIVQTTLTASTSQILTLHLVDAQGRTAPEDTQISIRVARNQPAAVKAVFPGRDTNVSALQEFRVQAQASDDFGLIDFGMEFSVSGGAPRQISLRTAPSPEPTAENPQPDKPLLSTEMTHSLDLESLGAAPDDVVVYSFWAVDRAPDGSERRTVGDLLFAEVRRFEEIFREGQQQAQQSAQQRQQQQGQQEQQGSAVDGVLNLQKEIISATWNVVREEHERRSAGTLAADLDAIAQSQQQASEQLKQALQQAPATPQIQALSERAQNEMQQAVQLLQTAGNDSNTRPGTALPPEQRVLQTLLKMRAAEFQVQQQQQQQGGGGGGGNSASQQQLQQLELDNNRNRYESERQAQEQQEASSQQREQLQVLNRLKELARRQQAVNERLKQLESELRAARSDQEREELERELKRLRDEQREMLRDVDELNERMQQSQTTQNQQQMQEARSNVQQASRAMDEGRLAEAIAEGTRAERRFENLREEFRNSTSSQFDEAVRDLRQQARELNEKQNELAQQLNGSSPENTPQKSPSLRSERNRDQISQSLQQQQDRLSQILDQSRQLIEQAEQSEPLLSERLYETLREVREQKPQEALEAAEMLAERGLWPQTQEAEQVARNGLQQLQQGIENAADAVLGSETEALRRAQSRLQQAANQLEQEVNDAEQRQSGNQQNSQPGQQPGQTPGQQPQPQAGDQQNSQPGQQPGQTPGQQPQPQSGDQQNSQPGQQQGQTPGQQPQPRAGDQQNSQPGQQPGQTPGQQPQPRAGDQQNPQPGQQPGQASGQQPQPRAGDQQNPQPGQQPGQASGQQPQPPSGDQQSSPGNPRSTLLNGGREGARAGDNNAPGRPLTGSEFSEWSDQLRDIEEMLEDPELRNRVAQVRDRARAIRAEFRRHGTEPQWNLVRSQLLNEMQQLQLRLAEELKKRESNRAMVPIDREPIPEEFDGLVQRYYQLLGQERTDPSEPAENK